jgi:ATP-dependent Clp protease ATP-binding subunit ClpA
MGFSNDSKKNPRDLAIKNLGPFFSPELLQRLDDVIVLSALEEEHLEDIVEIHLKLLKERAVTDNVVLSWDSAVVKLCAQRPQDDSGGARGVIRAVETLVAEPLGSSIMMHASKRKSSFRAVVKDEKIVIDQIKTTPQAGQGDAKKRKRKKDQEAV